MPTSIQLKKLKQLFTYFIALPAMLAVILAWTATDESVAQLRLDYAALRAAEDDYRAQREFGGLSGEEAADYASYVARLQRRVFEDCQVVLSSGSNAPEDLPCPTSVPPVTQSADIAMEAERTPEEQVAALDEMLMAGLGEYDERLLREQERIKAATPNDNSGSGDGNGDGMGGEGGDGMGGDGEGDSENGSEGEAGSKDQNSGGTAGDNSEAGSTGGQPRGGAVDSSEGSGDSGDDSDRPADIGDGSDDDIVARQLREAAENETDPELKAKLWEEYRRYKKGTS